MSKCHLCPQRCNKQTAAFDRLRVLRESKEKAEELFKESVREYK